MVHCPHRWNLSPGVQASSLWWCQNSQRKFFLVHLVSHSDAFLVVTNKRQAQTVKIAPQRRPLCSCPKSDPLAVQSRIRSGELQ